MSCSAADEHQVGRHRRALERRIDRHAERVCAVRNLRHLFPLQIPELHHGLDHALQLFRLVGRERRSVRVRADGAALVIGRVSIKGRSLGGGAPIRAARGQRSGAARDAGGRGIDKRDRDGLAARSEELLQLRRVLTRSVHRRTLATRGGSVLATERRASC